MKKIVALFVIILSLITAAVAADKPLGVEEYTSVDELAVTIASYFPKVQGEVKAVQGDRLTLSLAKKDGIIPGTLLTLWRDGKEIQHPVTHAVIGRVENEVGSVEVLSVGDATSTAVLKKKESEPKQGDKVRITPRKISIALLPLKADQPEIVQTLADRLKDFGRFAVLENGKVSAFIRDRKQRDSSLVREMGAAFGLDAVISIGIYPSEGKLLVTSRIFYTEDASQLDTIVATLDLRSKRDALGEVKPFFIPVKEEKTVTAELPVDARFFAVGDFEGDGRLEYAFLDAVQLHIYRSEPSGWREVWTESVPPEYREVSIQFRDSMSSTTQPAGIQYINIDAADINGDGKAEIFVTAMLQGKVFSYVVQNQDGAYRRTAEIPAFLRVLRVPGRGTILAGQDYDPKTFLSGPVKQYTWLNGKYVSGQDLSLPPGVGLYGFAFAEVGEQNPLLVAFNDEDRLIVYSRDTQLWKSEEKYGVVDAFVYKSATGVSAALSGTATESDRELRQRLRGRLFSLDINNDGKDEVLLPKNLGGTLGSNYKTADMNGLRWTGARLDQTWSVKNLPGPVLDFQALRLDGATVQIFALVKTQGGLFSKDRQQIMTYLVK